MTRNLPNGRRACRSPKHETWRSASQAVLGLCLLTAVVLTPFPLAAQNASPDFITVQAQEISPSLIAYGQVEPIMVTPVSAAESGVVTDLRVRPGTHVRAGERLARLSGPSISSLLLQSEADVRSAKAQFDAANKSLAIEQQQLSTHLTTRQAVQQMESAEAQARTALDNAQSRLTSVRQMMTVTAPEDGIVLTLSSADGALAGAGQTILTIQPAGGLWLRAMYYGKQLAGIHVGTTGSFAPADGSQAIAVRVVSIPGTVTTGGGESIALEPLNGHATWLNGEAGTVTLKYPPRKWVTVPTRALIVNQGKWWVLVRTSKGNHAQEVVPGPVEGWNTFIVSGLAPGTKIIVNNAYLLFHSGIAEQYQIPD